MFKSLFMCVILVLSGTSGAVFAQYDSSNFSSDGRKLQPSPSGHVVGKDNGPGKGTHNSGEECGACHRPNGKAPVAFTISGTLYEDRAGRKPLEGGEVILEDINGNVISMTSNEVGNFWTYAPIASNPYAVASHGGMMDMLYPADPNDTRSWQYKAWVKNGEHIRPMVTIAPVGGASDPNSRMSCSMHHGAMGSRGALWGSGKSTLRNYPRSHLSFKKHILPIFRNKCVPCHIPGETVTRMATQTDVEGNPTTVVEYSKLLDLTSLSGSSVLVNNVMWTKRGVGDMTVEYQDSPDTSPVLSKTIMQADSSIIHAGGAFWSASDADYKAVWKWIAEGAQNN